MSKPIIRIGRVEASNGGRTVSIEGPSTTRTLRGIWPFQWWETVEIVRRPSNYRIAKAVYLAGGRK